MLPAVSIQSVRCVYRDDEHHAFTDLCRFGGWLYLAFRSCPAGHGISAKARIRILRSRDGRDWSEVALFGVPDRDTRDPHLLVFRDRLFVYTGTWLCPEGWTAFDINDHLGYAAWTANGTDWVGPRPLEGTYGHYIWRAAAHGDRAYLCGRRKHAFNLARRGEGGYDTEAAMLESEDGLVWRYRGLFNDTWGDETAFVFSPDGTVTAVGRRLENRSAVVLRAAPPYDSWERRELDRHVGGPMLVEWQGRLLVGGRKALAAPVTALYWLVDGQLHEIAELPSGGDNSYPGFVSMGPDVGLLSYYSSHESRNGRPSTAIYLADLRLDSAGVGK
ncbi:MAG: hypothetical protein GX595_07615 [Lentisphaerae bacterium]|nr:hypothetical protein [Lentisphaerota bacterium]